MKTLLDNLANATIQKNATVEKLVNTNNQLTTTNKQLTETILMKLQKQNATLDCILKKCTGPIATKAVKTTGTQRALMCDLVATAERMVLMERSTTRVNLVRPMQKEAMHQNTL